MNLDLVVSDVRSLGDATPQAIEQSSVVIDDDDGLPPLTIEYVGSSNNNPTPPQPTNGFPIDVEMEEVQDPLETVVYPPTKTSTAQKDVENGCTSCEENRLNSTSENSTPLKVLFRNPCVLIFDSLRTTSRSKTASVLREWVLGC